VHAAAHVTGGGLPENLPRALPEDLGADLVRGSWEPGPAIAAVLATGRVAEEEAWRTFNMGLGMCVVVAEGDADAAVAAVPGARRVGRVTGPPGVRHG
jgi:phosphoribosylformylglycinamidine cyclo-ligase